jgi:vacuolar-type H+-ATPase subunit I/STV1
MQNCNTCPSNPKNKIYNYHTFNAPTLNKTDKPDNILIEGLDNATKVDMVTSNYSAFNQLYTEYLKCSIPNNSACAKLQTEYDRQTKKVEEIEPEYNSKSSVYNTCNNLKIRCEGINTLINGTQQTILELNQQIKDKQTVLDTCDGHLTMCKKINDDIISKKKEITALSKIIETNKKQFDKNLCDK